MIDQMDWRRVQQLSMRVSEQTTEIEAGLAREVALRDALEAVEWVDAGMVDVCPWCWQSRDKGHGDWCDRQAVLAQPSPRADAVRAVLAVVGKWRDDYPDGDKDLEEAWDAYRALLAGGDADGGAEW